MQTHLKQLETHFNYFLDFVFATRGKRRRKKVTELWKIIEDSFTPICEELQQTKGNLNALKDYVSHMRSRYKELHERYEQLLEEHTKLKALDSRRPNLDLDKLFE